MRKLFLRLNGAYPADEVVAELLDEKLQSKIFKKNEFLARERQVCRHLYYIEKGIVSHYSTKEEGDVTNWILWENDIVTSVDSFFQQIPSKEFIIAHEDTLVFYISYQDWAETFRKSDSFKFITDRIKTEYYARQTEHDRLIRLLPPDQLIKHVLGKNPELLDRVGKETFSSYLGMSVKTFNKYL